MDAPVHARIFGLRSGNRTAAAPALPRPVHSRTPAQVQKDNDAFRISKRWPISRRSTLSRGIHRYGNECYILSSIQGLLHLPQFMNWVLSHRVSNNGSVQNPCAYNAKLPRGHEDTSPNWYMRCVACAVKNLVTTYWGNYNSNRGKPLPLATTDAALIPIYAISDIIWPPIGGFRRQQDADEFQARLLAACFHSTPPIHTLWTDGYNALFRLEYDETWYCQGCRTPILSDPVNEFVNKKTYPNPELGFLAVRIRRQRAETVRRAIVRKMADDPRMTKHSCPAGKCGSSATVMRRYRIEAAPEYLRVSLGLVRYHSRGSSKIMHPVKVERTLDLTYLQRDPSTPLHYRLISVTSHRGPSFEAGHWIAAVQGPNQKYYAINDDTVRKETGSYMTLNPHDGSEATLLVYKRTRPSR